MDGAGRTGLSGSACACLPAQAVAPLEWLADPLTALSSWQGRGQLFWDPREVRRYAAKRRGECFNRLGVCGAELGQGITFIESRGYLLTGNRPPGTQHMGMDLVLTRALCTCLLLVEEFAYHVCFEWGSVNGFPGDSLHANQPIRCLDSMGHYKIRSGMAMVHAKRAMMPIMPTAISRATIAIRHS